MNRKEELEAFKSRINLSEFAAHLGYRLDKRASSRNSAIMAHDNGDKIVIARGGDFHWIYFSVRDPKDSGSIIDFAQHRLSMNIGQVRQELRPWLSLPGNRPLPLHTVQSLEPSSRDQALVLSKFHAASVVTQEHSFLSKQRGISASILCDPIFEDRIRTDLRGNCLFPHFNKSGLCGFEIKNHEFTGFSPGGEKGLWGSRPREGDQYLVICESAIDALSYAAIHSTGKSRFISTGGALNSKQPELIQLAMKRLNPGSQVIVAVDNDPAGDQLLEKLNDLYARLKLAECDLIEMRPEGRGKDWNDVLRASTASESPNLKTPHNSKNIEMKNKASSKMKPR